MVNQTPFPDLLLGRTLTFGQRRYRLQEVLGGGATAIVFLGVDPGDPENKDKQVAVKAAHDEEQWQEALKREWRNLRALAKAAAGEGTHYFPRALHPADEGASQQDDESALQQDVFLRTGWATFLILVQELVPGIGIHDLLLDYPPGLRLPEPLALEIARQYAQMLTILHSAGLTCADRKLADLRWEKKYDFKQGAQDDLLRWRTESPGHLMVLDWNVTEEVSQGPYGTVALDLFRFGILWHRMLLGVEPRFRRGVGWQLEESLEKHPVWPRLSFGTRQILSRLLHPVRDQRYLEASVLLGDLGIQISLWQAEGSSLESIFMPTHRRYAEREGNVGQREAEKAFGAADVLRVRIERWSEYQPTDFNNVHRGLRRAVVDAPFQLLREMLHRSEWDRVNEEIKRLQAETHNPALLLHLDRYRQIAAQSSETRSAWKEVKSLFTQSDLVFRFDTSDDELSEQQQLDDSHVRHWKVEAEAESDAGWKAVRQRLWQEIDYRLSLARARSLRDVGAYLEAATAFSHVLALREHLTECGDQVIPWLSQLYGDPTLELKEVEAIVKAGQRLEQAFEHGLQALSDDIAISDALTGVAAALRLFPDTTLLSRLYRVLEAKRDFHHVKGKSSLLLEIYHLGLVVRNWNTLVESGTDEESIDTLGQILKEHSSYIGNTIRDRQSELRRRVLHGIDLCLFTSLTQNAAEVLDALDDVWSARVLVESYQEAFPDDKQFLKEGQIRLRECEQQTKERLEFPRPVTLDGFKSQEHRLAEALRWAHRGQALATLLGEPWPEELRPEQIELKVEEARGCLGELMMALSRLITAP